MARLVADLLSLSRIELNEHSVPTGTARLDGVLASVADSLAMRAGGAQHEHPAARRSARLPPVQGDNDELVQLFQNLIDNAIKYGRAGSAGRASRPGAASRRPP